MKHHTTSAAGLFLAGSVLVALSLYPQGHMKNFTLDIQNEGRLKNAKGAVLMASLAGFKGITLNVLWIKLLHYQEEKNYYRIPPLGDLIVQLEPYLTNVWEFIGSTMIFDIVAYLEDQPTRLQWMLEGFEFMENGCRQNKSDFELAYKLGSLYFFRFQERNRSYIGDLEYYETKLKEIKGRDSLENARYWLEKSIQINHLQHAMIDLRASTLLVLCYEQQAARAMQTGQIESALLFLDKSIQCRESLLRKHYDNPDRDEKLEELRAMREQWRRTLHPHRKASHNITP